MFSTPHFKTSHPLPAVKPSSALGSTKIKNKNLIHTLIVSHMCRVIRVLSKVKGCIVKIILKIRKHCSHKKHCSRKTKNIIMGSFRLHYNWCSSKPSHFINPVPYQGKLPSSAVNSVDQQQQGGEEEEYYYHDSELVGYLQWLEDGDYDEGRSDQKEIIDVDMMAETFIANCHEKFKLEKQESDRRFQEMLARVHRTN